MNSRVAVIVSSLVWAGLLVTVGLRVCGVIAWGWLWVLAPLWGTVLSVWAGVFLFVTVQWVRHGKIVLPPWCRVPSDSTSNGSGPCHR